MSARQANPPAADALALGFPPALIDAIADAVVARISDAIGAAPQSPYVDADQAAAYLRCDCQRIYDLVYAGKLKPRRDGRRLLFHRADLDRYLAEQ
jgi:excisionase family DNA binding protein